MIKNLNIGDIITEDFRTGTLYTITKIIKDKVFGYPLNKKYYNDKIPIEQNLKGKFFKIENLKGEYDTHIYSITNKLTYINI